MLTLLLAGGIGLMLGLLGGGGSILTVPLLKYVAGLGTHAAIATSLLVVGTSALAALVPHALGGHVRWRAGAVFGLAGMLGAQLGGRAARFVPEAALLAGFSVMMLVTAIGLYRCRRCDGAPVETAGPPRPPARRGRLLLQGFAVGVLTGLLGVGGGFLIVPALTLLAGLSTRSAVATSLLVIALNSLSGFAAHAGGVVIDAGFVAPLILACVAGSLGGSLLADRVPQRALRRGFAGLVVAVAIAGLLAPLWVGAGDRGAAVMGASGH